MPFVGALEHSYQDSLSGFAASFLNHVPGALDVFIYDRVISSLPPETKDQTGPDPMTPRELCLKGSPREVLILGIVGDVKSTGLAEGQSRSLEAGLQQVNVAMKAPSLPFGLFWAALVVGVSQAWKTWERRIHFAEGTYARKNGRPQLGV